MYSHSAGECPVGDGARVVESDPARARHADGAPAGLRLAADADVRAHEAGAALDPRAPAVDENVGDSGGVDECR